MSYARKPKFVEKREDGHNDRDSSQEHRRDTRRDDRRNDRRYDDRHPDPYVMDERKITAHTPIDPLPEHRKNPPNEANFKEKLAAVNKEITSLKEERVSNELTQTKEKDRFRELTKGQRTKIDEITDNIKLGEDCIRLLEKDIYRIEINMRKDKEALHEFEYKVGRATKKPVHKEKKPIEAMNFYELKQEIDKLEQRLCSETLDKKASEAINRDINKLKTLQVNAPKENAEDSGHSDQVIQRHLNDISKLKEERTKNLLRKLEIEVKIDAITNQILKLEQDKARMNEDLQKLKDGEEYVRAKQIKEKILSLRKDRTTLQAKYEKAQQEYEEEQKKIQYIMWANEIKKKKKEEEDYERQKKKKEKQREQQYKENKEKGGKEGDKDKAGKDKAGKDKDKPKDPREAEQEERRFRPPPPHPFANEMSDCRFLIRYCEDIKPKTENQTVEEKKLQDFNLQEAIRQGSWAKEKGISVIESKKRDVDEEEIPKRSKKLNKTKPNKEQLPTLEHTIEIVRLFDNYKIVPPTKNEQIDAVIKALQAKIDYYKDADPHAVPRVGEQEPKVYRKKEDDRPKKIALNASDFPSL